MSFYTTYPIFDPFYITVDLPEYHSHPQQRSQQQRRRAAPKQQANQKQAQSPPPSPKANAASLARGIEQQAPPVRKFTPQTDFFETSEGYGVDISLPGVRKEDVEVEYVSERRLLIRGKKRVGEETTEGGEPANKKRKYWVNERVSGEFARNIEFPGDVDADSTTVKLEAGVLSLRVNKMVRKPRGKIAVEYVA